MFDGGGFSGAGYGAPAIGGALPFGSSPGLPGGSPQAIAQNYGQSYNNALSMNQSNYNNVLSGYQQSIAAQTTAQQAIQTGYSDLYNKVISHVAGVGQSRQTDINDAAAKNLAAGSQQLISRGLGNTTIQSSFERGVSSDRERSSIQNDESIARMTGDYMSSLGIAGLRSQQAGVDNITGLRGQQLGFMNSVTSKYPDAGMYGSLAMQAGHQLGDAGRGNRGAGSSGGGAFGAAPGGRLGYVPAARYDGGGGYGGGAASTSGGIMPGSTGGYGGGGYGGDYGSSGDNAFAGYGGGGDYGGSVSPGYDKPAADFGGGFDYGALGGAVAGGAAAGGWDDYAFEW